MIQIGTQTIYQFLVDKNSCKLSKVEQKKEKNTLETIKGKVKKNRWRYEVMYAYKKIFLYTRFFHDKNFYKKTKTLKKMLNKSAASNV